MPQNNEENKEETPASEQTAPFSLVKPKPNPYEGVLAEVLQGIQIHNFRQAMQPPDKRIFETKTPDVWIMAIMLSLREAATSLLDYDKFRRAMLYSAVLILQCVVKGDEIFRESLQGSQTPDSTDSNDQ